MPVFTYPWKDDYAAWQIPSGMDDSIHKLANILQQAGVPVSTTDNIKGALWSKVLYNCALNPLGAIMGVPYGKLERSTCMEHNRTNDTRSTFMITAAEKFKFLE